MTSLPPEIERLARLVGTQTGKTAEQVIREAVEAHARLAGVEVPPRPRKEIDLARVREITRRVASRPLLDERGVREIREEAWRRHA